MTTGAKAWRGPVLTAVGVVVLVVGLLGLVGGGDDEGGGEASDVTTTVADPTSETSEAPAATTSTTLAATTTTLALDEAIPFFLVSFNTAFASGDAGQVLALLHPAVFDTFGEGTCRSYLEGLAGTPQPALVYREHAEPEDWGWEVDGQLVAVPDAVAVEVDREISGQTIIQEIHVATVDGELRTFVDCTGA